MEIKNKLNDLKCKILENKMVFVYAIVSIAFLIICLAIGYDGDKVSLIIGFIIANIIAYFVRHKFYKIFSMLIGNFALAVVLFFTVMVGTNSSNDMCMLAGIAVVIINIILTFQNKNNNERSYLAKLDKQDAERNRIREEKEKEIENEQKRLREGQETYERDRDIVNRYEKGMVERNKGKTRVELFDERDIVKTVDGITEVEYKRALKYVKLVEDTKRQKEEQEERKIKEQEEKAKRLKEQQENPTNKRIQELQKKIYETENAIKEAQKNQKFYKKDKQKSYYYTRRESDLKADLKAYKNELFKIKVGIKQ